jgi:hypothetical protein
MGAPSSFYDPTGSAGWSEAGEFEILAGSSARIYGRGKL